MGSSLERLTWEDFESSYQDSDDRFEYWFGEAKRRSHPTTIHGRLQFIVMQLLEGAGLFAASEVELRIVAEAYPKPDVIADLEPLERPYLTKAVAIVVEILSDNDNHIYLKEKCRNYQRWGFGSIYVVDPRDRSVCGWIEDRLQPVTTIVSNRDIPVSWIWEKLDLSVRPSP